MIRIQEILDKVAAKNKDANLELIQKAYVFAAAAHAGQEERQKPMPMHVEKKVGRNDPCPCGSGKKYKNCHGKGL